MQTIEEYKEYTKQLEGEVGKWHHAYDALIIERNQMAKTLCENKKIIETMATELDELRKHEVEWDLAQARIKELETENKSAKDEEINAIYQKSLARLHELARKMYPDEEEDHGEADGILCDMLNALGYKDLTDAWDDIKKWYSKEAIMSEERLNTFRTFEKKMEEGSIVVYGEIKPKTVMEYEQICKAVEDFRDRVRHQEEPFFDKLPEEVKTEIQRAHLEMVLNQDFKPIYVNVAPTAPAHKVKIDTEVKP